MSTPAKTPFFPQRAVARKPGIGQWAEALQPQQPVPGMMGMLEAGNIDTTNRPIVQNMGGLNPTSSTVRSISIGTDNGTVLIPTVSEDGRILTDQQAIQQFKQTGKHLGRFANEQNADEFAQSLHNQQAGMLFK